MDIFIFFKIIWTFIYRFLNAVEKNDRNFTVFSISVVDNEFKIVI